MWSHSLFVANIALQEDIYKPLKLLLKHVKRWQHINKKLCNVFVLLYHYYMYTNLHVLEQMWYFYSCNYICLFSYIYGSLYIITCFIQIRHCLLSLKKIMFMSYFRLKVPKLVEPSYEIIPCKLGKRRNTWRGVCLKKPDDCGVSNVHLADNLLFCINCTQHLFLTVLVKKNWSARILTVQSRSDINTSVYWICYWENFKGIRC